VGVSCVFLEDDVSSEKNKTLDPMIYSILSFC